MQSTIDDVAQPFACCAWYARLTLLVRFRRAVSGNLSALAYALGFCDRLEKAFGSVTRNLRAYFLLQDPLLADMEQPLESRSRTSCSSDESSSDSSSYRDALPDGWGFRVSDSRSSSSIHMQRPVVDAGHWEAAQQWLGVDTATATAPGAPSRSNEGEPDLLENTKSKVGSASDAQPLPRDVHPSQGSFTKWLSGQSQGDDSSEHLSMKASNKLARKMDSRQHPFLLYFRDPALEKEFYCWHAKQQTKVGLTLPVAHTCCCLHALALSTPTLTCCWALTSATCVNLSNSTLT